MTHTAERSACVAMALSWLVFAPLLAFGGDDELGDLRARVAALERELEDLRRARQDVALRDAEPSPPAVDARADDRSAASSGFAGRVRLSGNADVIHRRGRTESPSAEGASALENFRLFLDLDLDGDGRRTGGIARSASFYLESDLVRDGELKNKIGSAYVRLDGLFDAPWLHFKLGRMPIPFGEEYLRFSEDRPRNPFLSFTAQAPYQWDEGAMFFGSFGDGMLAYEVAALDGDDAMGANTDSDMAWSGRLHFRPTRGVRLTLSALHTGELGSSDAAAKSALEFGGSHAVPFGDPGGVTSYQDGVALAPNPDRTLDGLFAWQADVTLEPTEYARIWLSYGQANVDASGASTYDRDFRFFSAESELDLGLMAGLDRFYVAGRFSAIGTFDRDRGYAFDAENGASELGFNTRSVDLWQAVLGYRLRSNVTLKAEISRYDHDLVRGVPAALARRAKARDSFAAGVSVGF